MSTKAQTSYMTAGRNIQNRNIRNHKNSKNRQKIRRQKRRRLCLRIVLLLVILLAGYRLLKPNEGMSYDSKYKSSRPQQLSSEEIRDRLQKLAKQYPEFEEILDNSDQYPEKLLSALCNNPDMIDYVKGYPNADGKVHGGLTSKELSQDSPLLLQWDARWGYVDYGDNKMGLSGCAPTCLSMVIVTLTKNVSATPDAVAKYAEENGFYMEGTGTAWSLMTEGSKHFGVHGSEIGLNKSVIFSKLEAGHPIICSVRPGDFTTAGHFIVLAGVENGEIRVHDPNSIARSNQLWDYETLEGQIKNLWTFTKD